jgi:hypothetical protein
LEIAHNNQKPWAEREPGFLFRSAPGLRFIPEHWLYLRLNHGIDERVISITDGSVLYSQFKPLCAIWVGN